MAWQHPRTAKCDGAGRGVVRQRYVFNRQDMAEARLTSRLSPAAHAFERTGALKRGAGKGNDRSRPGRERGPGFGSIWRGRLAWGSTSNTRVEDQQPGNQQV